MGEAAFAFMLATGIECSAPTIAGGVRQDQLLRTGHWHRYEEDLDLVRGLGISWLRYGIPFHVVAREPGRFDWAWTDLALAAIRERGIEPIVDLLHFGLPDDLWGFGDPALRERYLPYVRAFVERYPWVRWYTPVNEPFISADFSARKGWWNERLRDDRAFVRALDNVLSLDLEAMAIIREARPDARFIQSDGCEAYRLVAPADPAAVAAAELHDGLRFVGFDLTLGRRPDEPMVRWLAEHGLGEERLAWYAEHASRDGFVVGLDYYRGNERIVAAGGEIDADPAPRGFATVARQYHERYGLPFMLAETNHGTDGAVAWLDDLWAESRALLDAGLPYVGFCWYSLTDQVDWDTSLAQDNGRVNPLGLVDLDRRIRPVGTAYSALAALLSA